MQLVTCLVAVTAVLLLHCAQPASALLDNAITQCESDIVVGTAQTEKVTVLAEVVVRFYHCNSCSQTDTT